jgi:hypothetical protein
MRRYECFVLHEIKYLKLPSAGILHTTSAAYEPDLIPTFDKWFGSGRGSYYLGPIMPSLKGEGAKAGELMQSPQGSDIQAFLDKSLNTHGPHSVLYVSYNACRRNQSLAHPSLSDIVRFLLVAG